jgi:hypothetical protein
VSRPCISIQNRAQIAKIKAPVRCPGGAARAVAGRATKNPLVRKGTGPLRWPHLRECDYREQKSSTWGDSVKGSALNRCVTDLFSGFGFRYFMAVWIA